MIRAIEPSETMTQAFPVLHEAATKAFGKLEMPRRGEKRSLIDTRHIHGVNVLTVFEAKRHRDTEFSWTCLWVIYSAGHVLHCQRKLGRPVETAALEPGSVVAFDAGRDWHWTSGGNGILVVAPVEFSNADFTENDVRREFDGKLSLSDIKPHKGEQTE